ncbi:hypothetical protein SB778_32070 [Paraburkholderia sp. SIMBA_050]
MPDSATDLHRFEVPVTHEDLSVVATALHGRRNALHASVLSADVADLIARARPLARDDMYLRSILSIAVSLCMLGQPSMALCRLLNALNVRHPVGPQSNAQPDK